jgi:hypothetical protein
MLMLIPIYLDPEDTGKYTPKEQVLLARQTKEEKMHNNISLGHTRPTHILIFKKEILQYICLLEMFGRFYKIRKYIK